MRDEKQQTPPSADSGGAFEREGVAYREVELAGEDVIWAVYAGADGDVLVDKRDGHGLVRPDQTWVDGYLMVSIRAEGRALRAATRAPAGGDELPGPAALASARRRPRRRDPDAQRPREPPVGDPEGEPRQSEPAHAAPEAKRARPNARSPHPHEHGRRGAAVHRPQGASPVPLGGPSPEEPQPHDEARPVARHRSTLTYAHTNGSHWFPA